MKLEKLNDNQIRATLTKDDLAARRIKISELAYGTEKTRSLFHELMEQASRELDFDAEDIPLMIEAIPLSPECLILTVTKVEDPEELDTRFAKFSPSLLEDIEESGSETEDLFPDSDELLNIFNQIAGVSSSNAIPAPVPGGVEAPKLTRIFSFGGMHDVIKMAEVLSTEFTGDSSLYKDTSSGRYILLIYQAEMELLTFNRVCNIISEYGESEKSLLATSAYLKEHFEQIIESDAILRLSSI